MQSQYGSHFGFQNGGYNELHDSCSNSIEEEEEGQQDEQEWGLTKEMELFEVSAKDDLGESPIILHIHSVCSQT